MSVIFDTTDISYGSTESRPPCETLMR